MKTMRIKPDVIEIDTGEFMFTDIELLLIPKSVKVVKDFAFFNCSKLEVVYFDVSVEDFKKIKFGTLPFPSNAKIMCDYKLKELIDSGYNIMEANKILNQVQELKDLLNKEE